MKVGATTRAGTAVAALLTLLLTGFTPLLSEEGKMPITTSSEEAREAYLEGLTFLDRSQPESARPLFHKAVELDPDFMLALDALRRCSPTFKVARELSAEMQQRAPEAPMSDGERLYFDAMFAAFNGDRQGQLKKLEKLAEMYPQDERVLYQLGLFHFGNDDAEAVRLFRKAQNVNPEFVPVYNLLGYGLRSLGKYDEAEDVFRKAIALEPDNPNAYDSYADLLLKLGRHDESIANYDKALQQEPLFPSAQIGVAANLILQGNHKSARERLTALFEIAPHDGIRSGIHWALSVTYLDEGKYEKALHELEENYRLSKKGNDHGAMSLDLRNMATVLMAAGKWEQAAEKFEQATKLSLEDPNQNDRGRAFVRAFIPFTQAVIAIGKGDLATAKAKATEFEKLATPLNAPFMIQNVHELKGRIALAEEAYDRALEELAQANSTEVYNMYRIAQAYEERGDLKEAGNMYHYVVTYHSPLNYNYSIVRHKAEERLERLRS